MKAASVQAQQAQVNTSLTVVAQAGSLVTLEMLLYGVIVLIAAVLRFLNLNAAPMMPFEAAQAWAAWNGSPLPTGGSPLFYTLNQILFGVLGSSAGDAGVRIGAAVIGTGMVLLPALYRKQIGRFGALAASSMLAISPTLVLASRSLDAQIVAAACTLAAIGFGLRYIDAPNRNTLIALSIAIGLALTSGPGVVTILVIIAPALFVSYRWIASDADRAQLQQVRQDSHVIRTGLIWGGATFVLVSTALMLRPTSFASVPEMFSAWIASWGGNNTVSALRLFQILLIYEPLIVWSGLAGLIMGLRRIHGIVVLLSVWALGASIVALLQPGRQPFDLVLMLTPLALLGGMSVEELANALARHGSWKVEGLFWLVTTPVIGYLAITSGSYAVGHALLGNAHLFGGNLNPFASYVILLAISAIVLSGIFVIAIGWHATARAAAVTLICGFGLISFGNAWGVTQVRPGDPRELLWGPVSTSAEIRAMVQAIEAASKRQTGFSDRGSIAMDLSQDDPLLQWYLRDFRNIKSGISEHESAPIMIAPPGSALPPLQGSYAGKQFPIRLTWEPSTLSEQALLHWWLYRESDQPPNPLQSEVLWVRARQ